MNSSDWWSVFIIAYFSIPLILMFMYRNLRGRNEIASLVAGVIAMIAFLVNAPNFFNSIIPGKDSPFNMFIMNALIGFIIGFIAFYLFVTFFTKKQTPQYAPNNPTRYQPPPEEPPYYPNPPIVYQPPAVYEVCPACGGRGKHKVDDITGGIAGSVVWHYEKCKVCNGTGKIRVR